MQAQTTTLNIPRTWKIKVINGRIVAVRKKRGKNEVEVIDVVEKFAELQHIPLDVFIIPNQ